MKCHESAEHELKLQFIAMILRLQSTWFPGWTWMRGCTNTQNEHPFCRLCLIAGCVGCVVRPHMETTRWQNPLRPRTLQSSLSTCESFRGILKESEGMRNSLKQVFPIRGMHLSVLLRRNSTFEFFHPSTGCLKEPVKKRKSLFKGRFTGGKSFPSSCISSNAWRSTSFSSSFHRARHSIASPPTRYYWYLCLSFFVFISLTNPNCTQISGAFEGPGIALMKYYVI